MARKPTDYVQFKLRIRESLRRKIEAAAEKQSISANAEAVGRLEASFERDTMVSGMADRIEGLEKQARKYIELNAELRAEGAAALRDTRLLTMMAGSDENARLLRHVIPALQEFAKPGGSRKLVISQDAQGEIELGFEMEGTEGASMEEVMRKLGATKVEHKK